MHFPSTKSLVLSLLASGPLAFAAPTQLKPAASQSVQPHHHERNAILEFHDDSVRRRSSEAIVIPSQHLYGRTSSQPGGRPGDKEPKKNPNEPNDPNPVADPNPVDDNPGQEQRRPDNEPNPNGEVDMHYDPLDPFPVDSPEWNANKPRLISKGEGLISKLQTTIDNNAPDTGNKRKVVGPAGLGFEETNTAADTSDFHYLTNEPFNMVLGDDWQTRKIHEGEYTALEVTVSKSNRLVSVGNSVKAEGLSWTQAMFDSLMTLMGGAEGLKTLKWIERNTIISWGIEDSQGVRLETPDAIDFAFRTLGGKAGDTVVVDFASQEATMVEARNYLAAQTHVARVLQLLGSYHEEFGNKQIAKLHLFNEATTDVGEYGIVIELTE